MNNVKEAKSEIEVINSFVDRIISKLKGKHGIDIKFGTLSLVFHNGRCVRVMAEPKIRVAEIQHPTTNEAAKHLRVAK